MSNHVKIFIASGGKITALPGMFGPIDVPFIVDAETALAIAMEGHTVYANTTFKGDIRLTEDILLDFMDNYGITDEDIRRKIEESIKMSKEYENLTTVKDVVDKLMKLQGILVPGYDSMELIGKSIKAILNSEKLSSFKDVENSLVVLDNKIDDNYRKINDSEKIDSFKDIELLFDSVFTDIDNIKSVIFSKIQGILNGVYLSSFKDVEDLVARLFNGDYIHNIKDIEDVLSSLHAQGTDIEIGKGTDYHLTAEYISNTLIYLKQNNIELFDRLVKLSIFMADKSATIDDISVEIAKILNSDTIKSFKDVETAVNAVHEQGTDIEIGKGTEFHITAEDISKFMNKTVIDTTEQEMINKSIFIAINAILNSDTIKSFKDVETAVNAVHEQGTDIEIGKGTEFHITAEDMINSLKTISINVLANTDKVNLVDAKVDSILNSNKFKTFLDVELALNTVHTQGTDVELGKGTENHITVDELLVMKDKIESALEAGAVILVEETITSAVAKYLPQMPDNQTIFVNGVSGKFEARTLKGLSSTIAELNANMGIKSNIQIQFDTMKSDYQAKIEALQGAGGFSGYYETNAERLAATGVGDGIYIVSIDESHSGNSTMWRYRSSNSSWVYLGKFNIEVRDFASKPISLSSEVTSVLPKNRIDVSFIAEIELLKTKVHAKDGDSYLDFGLPTQVSAVEIKNGLDKIKYLTAVNAASLIDDSKSQIAKTYSSNKIEEMFSNIVTKDYVYSKETQDTVFMKTSDYQPHENYDVIRKITEDNGKLLYNGEDIFARKDVLSINGDISGELSSESMIFDLVAFCLNKSVIYPIQTVFYIYNKDTVKPLTFKVVVNQDLVITNEVLQPGECRGYRYNPSYNDMRVLVNGNYRLTTAVVAHRLQDFIDLINVHYHIPNTDTVLAEGTIDECRADEIKRIINLMKDVYGNPVHNRNGDIAIGEGTEFYMTAEYIYNKLTSVNAITQTAVINITTSPKEVNIPISSSNKTILQVFKTVYDASNSNVVTVISEFNNADSTVFNGDTNKFIFDSKLYLRDNITTTVYASDYQSGKLAIFDYLSVAERSILLNNIKSMKLKFTPVFSRPKTINSTPPSGYIRHDNTSTNIEYVGLFNDVADSGAYNGSYKESTTIGDKIRFNFTGDKLRIYTKLKSTNTSSNSSIKITVDDIEYTYNEYMTNISDICCACAVTGLNPMISHTVTIENLSSNSLSLDCIDIAIGSLIRPYNTIKEITGGILFKKSISYYKYDIVSSQMVLVTDGAPTESDFLNSGMVDIPVDEQVLDYSIYVYAKDYTINDCTVKYVYKSPEAFIYAKSNKKFNANIASIKSIILNSVQTGDSIIRIVIGNAETNEWYGFNGSYLVDVDITSYSDIIANGSTPSQIASMNADILNNFKSNGIAFGYLISNNNGTAYVDSISLVIDILGDLELVPFGADVKVRYQYGNAKITFTNMISENVIINKI